MNHKVDAFLLQGCGRCKYYQTSQCKVHRWSEELRSLRGLIVKNNLVEVIKWGFPCYTVNGKNVLMLAAFKDHCAISFFKGALLKENPLLESGGENSNSFRLIRFQGIDKIVREKEAIIQLIKVAIEIEKSGKKIAKTDYSSLDIPEELVSAFEDDCLFKSAFTNLTPGRQRGYLIFFSNAKQSETRKKRIEKYKASILLGKGLNE
jgi:uncharacterized protein YdeI (YjbR/CyaY-like superfamily)